MRHIAAIALMAVLGAFALVPPMAGAAPGPAWQAGKATVSDAQSLSDALGDEGITEVVLGGDVDVKDLATFAYEEGQYYDHFKSALFIDHALTLDLNGHALTDSSGEYRTLLAVGTPAIESPLEVVIKDSMGGGYISKSYYADEGGAVAVHGKGTKLTLQDVDIKGSEAKKGGGVYLDGATVVMEGGSISGNEALSGRAGQGGGVFVGNDATFELRSGVIEGNKADEFGGGVYVGLCATFIMTGGEVKDNSLDAFPFNGGGAGIYIHLKSKVELKGGSITGNRILASDSDDKGAGVFLPFETPSLIISGNVKIAGNYSKDSANRDFVSNLTIAPTSTFKVDALPDVGGVHVSVNPDPAEGHVSAQVDEGIELTGHLRDYFVSDVPGCYLNDEGVWTVGYEPGPEGTSVAVSTVDRPVYGDVIEVAVKVTTNAGKPVTQGSVKLAANGTDLGEEKALDSSGTATFGVDTGALGMSYTLKASYQGGEGISASVGSLDVSAAKREVQVLGTKATGKIYDGASDVSLDVSAATLANVLDKDKNGITVAEGPVSARAVDAEGNPVSDAGSHGVAVDGSPIRFVDPDLSACYMLASENPFGDGVTVRILPAAVGQNGYGVQASLGTSSIAAGGSFSELGARVEAVGVDGRELAGQAAWYLDADHARPVAPGHRFDAPGSVELHWVFAPESGNYEPAEGRVALTVQDTPLPDPIATFVDASVAQERISYGDVLEVRAQVGAEGAQPAGTVRVLVDSHELVSASLDSEGSVAFSMPTAGRMIPLGTHEVTVEYAGEEGAYLPSSTSVRYTLDQREIDVTPLTALSRPFDGSDRVELDMSGMALIGVVGSDDVTLEISDAKSVAADGLAAADAGVHPVSVDARIVDRTGGAASRAADADASYYRLAEDAFDGLSVRILPAAVGQNGYGVQASLETSSIAAGGSFSELGARVEAVGVDGRELAGQAAWYLDADHARPVAPGHRFDAPGSVELHWVFAPESGNYEPATGSVTLTVTEHDGSLPDGGQDAGTSPSRGQDDAAPSDPHPSQGGGLAATGDTSSGIASILACGAALIISGLALRKRALRMDRGR